MVLATFFDTANVRFASTAATFSSLEKTRADFISSTVHEQSKEQHINLKPRSDTVILFIDFIDCKN